MLLKELTSLNGVSGDEDAVREFIRKLAAEYADELTVDRLGNLIAFKKGTASAYKVMLSAHMDEVGLIVTAINEDGSLKFDTVGGMDNRILPGKRVLLYENGIAGVIGVKPVHLLKKEEREKVISIKELYIDIGASKREEAEKLTHLGAYAAFESDYLEFGDGTIKAKALDDRIGCCALLEALKCRFGFDLYVCFTVQEEVGLRGAEVAAHRVEPDIAIVVEGTTCSDVPGVDKQDYSTVLGEGPALTIMDKTSYPDRNLVDYIYRTAITYGIKVQFKQTVSGGNDAGRIQRSRGGVHTAVISAPCRYIHSPSSVVNKNDYESLIKLVTAVLDEFDRNPEGVANIMDGRKIDA